MILIADSGSTKTTWASVESGSKMVTEGLNPHFTTDEQFLAACAAVCRYFQFPTSPFQLFFYGSGCGDSGQRQRVKHLLIAGLQPDDIHVETDMLGACRAVCGDQAGLVGILGTGSNACYYDGNAILRQAVSTGYVLGDHGSACHVGRMLLNAYLCHSMPGDIADKFHEAFPMSYGQFMDAVYHQPHPNRFLASLAPFALVNKRYNYCYQILKHSLYEWNKYQMSEVREFSACDRLAVVGGFGARLKTTLSDFAGEEGFVLGTVVADPVKGLLDYHRK